MINFALWVQSWFERLHYTLPVLGIFSEGYITAFDITQGQCESTAQSLKVDISDAVLKQYTSYSVRTGACVLLYEQGKSAVFIKLLVLEV